jgi:nicotinamide-nucleotide amidase
MLKELMLASPPLTLAVAESLTGGRLQARITAISGASGFFLGGVCAYTLEEKVRLLGVDRAVAAAVDCVSEEVARQMARGARRMFGADWVVATTGYAEPVPARGVAVPFAWWALVHGAADRSGAERVRTGRVEVPGLPRTAVQDRVVEAAFEALLGQLLAWRRGTLLP